MLERSLLAPVCYPHAVEAVEMHETHISWVFLAGPYAYKVKKPVALGFLDFSTLAARRHYCEEELRLNRRFAPEIYLDVVEIRGTLAAPRIGGSGPLLDYALRMRRFPQDALATRLLARNALTPELITDFARDLARLHSTLPPIGCNLPYGTTESVLRRALQNFEQIAPLLERDEDAQDLSELRDWTEREFLARYGDLRGRRESGRVRECHGDLHLRNIVLLGGRLVPFDCIEFSAELRWNDVMSEVAFLVMDLMDQSAPDLAWLFLDAYLEETGDYAGLGVLRFYLVYRAMVRAKVHLMRARQPAVAAQECLRLVEAYRRYAKLARTCSDGARPVLIVMHGLSGSGKSSVAAALVPALGAVRIRSDVERKRLLGLAPLAASGSGLESGLYAADMTQATYAHLAAAAQAVAAAGYTAIVDAAFLKRSQRAGLVKVASSLGVPVTAIDAHAPVSVLRERIAHRAGDPSEATLEVLERQLITAEPIESSEGLQVIAVDTSAADAADAARTVAERLAALALAPPIERTELIPG
jgi:hypothetical protein